MSIVEHAASARRETGESRYPVNIRLTVPFLPRPFFITVVAGWERRAPGRRREERNRHPLGSLGNFVTFVATSTVFFVALLFAALVAATL